MMFSLAEKMRPKKLTGFVGQKHLLESPKSPLRRILDQKRPVSVVFWGPPGCGKTTLAKLYLEHFNFPRVSLHSTSSQTQDFRKVIDRAKAEPLFRPTLIWVDEVHRLNRPQQDLLLPCLEDGSIILVAATTENPSFQLSPALLSRIHVLTLVPLTVEDLQQLVAGVEEACGKLPLTDEAKSHLCHWACGDARVLLNWLEQVQGEEKILSEKDLAQTLLKKTDAIDPTGEKKYQLISALHKAVRGSDCQAALYWLCRMIIAGEDLRYLGRRIIRMAIEDVGLADPTAVTVALNALTAFETLGSPEGELALAQATVYLALAPKSNAIYSAYKSASEDASKTSHFATPPHLVNPATRWMRTEGFGKGYIYEHDLAEGYSGQRFFPEGMEEGSYYHPVERGFERDLAKRIEYFMKLKELQHYHVK